MLCLELTWRSCGRLTGRRGANQQVRALVEVGRLDSPLVCLRAKGASKLMVVIKQAHENKDGRDKEAAGQHHVA